MTMISRVLGLVRDVVLARTIGAEAGADAFFVAFKIPNFFRRLFAEGAFAQAFVPVLSEYREQGSVAAVRHLIDRIAGCLGMSLVLLTAFVILASPIVAGIFSFGFYLDYVNGVDVDKFWLTSDLLRITFPYLLLISITGLCGAILNSYDQFAVPAVTPVFLNITLILAAVIASPWFGQPVYALAWGVLTAGCVQLVFQVPFLLRLGLMPHPKVDWSDESVRKVLKLMAPAMFGVSVSQINLLLDTVLASFLPAGSISWLYFSDRLVELPLGVFGVGIATVILPNLSRQFAKGGERFSDTIDWSIRMVLLISVPATLALVILAKPLLFTLFQYDKYAVSDVYMASMSMQAYALGLSAFMLIKVLASSFFSRQDTKTPVRIGIIAMVSNMVLNIIFVVPLHFIWQVGHVGLALATSISAFLNAGLLYRQLRQNDVYLLGDGWRRFMLQLVLSCGVMTAILLTLMHFLPGLEDKLWHQRVQILSTFVVCGGFSYLATLFLSGLRLKHLKLHLN